MTDKTFYYSIYRKEPFEDKKECLEFEEKEYKKRKDKLEKLSLREDLNEKSTYNYMEGWGPLFPKLRILEYFSLKPSELNDYLDNIQFHGNWYTIHNKKEHILFKEVIEEITDIKENELPEKDYYPYTLYAATYKQQNENYSFHLEDYTLLNYAKNIIRCFKKDE